MRGFEKFCIGRRAELMPQLTSRIAVYVQLHITLQEPKHSTKHSTSNHICRKKLRELLYTGYIIYDHTLTSTTLVDQTSSSHRCPTRKTKHLRRHRKAGMDVAKNVISIVHTARKSQRSSAAKHSPSLRLTRRISKALSEATARKSSACISCRDFAEFSIKLFHDFVLNNAKYVGLIKSQAYTMPTYYMGMVDENNKVNFYDGKVRVVDPKGNEFVKFDAQDYLKHVGEHVEEWTYSKFPYLKAVGGMD
jgi:F420-non-reducing hydrogenase large subunit